nr:hypothetical protein [Tanacetum cinerariifolium]
MATTIKQQAFLVTADVPEIYMQEFWATATVHQHSIRFKMDTRKHIVDLESFREMLHISPRVLGQSFAELPFEEEILEFFSLRLSQAQILLGLYHRRNVDFAFLIWEDLVYQVEHKNQKKSNEMYYPRFTKVIIHHFMTKNPSIPRRNRVNCHYVRDDVLFSTIKVVSRHQTTQQYGAILPIELTTEDIKNTKSYKEYYACATGEATPKPKASARKKKGGSAASTTPPTLISTPTPTTTVVATPRLSAAAKGKQPTRARNNEDADNNEEDPGLRIGEEERMNEEEEADELYRDVDINQGRGLQVSQETEDSHVILTPTQSDAQQEILSTSPFMNNLLNHIIDPDSIQRENDEILKTIDENMKKIIKEQVKTQVKAQVTRILPRIEESVNAQLEAEVLTRSSHSSRTSYAVAADLSEMELKKILIDKMEGKKSIQRSDEQQNLYKALVEAYDADKTIMDTYGESTILKRRRENDDQEGPFAGSDRGSKKQRKGGEHASASTPSEPAIGSASRSTTGSQSRQLSAKPISNDKHALWGVSHWVRKRQQFYGFAVNQEFALDVYSKRRIIAVTKLKIVEWHNYKHLDWISVRRDDDKIYKFKEGDLKRLRIQDIEDMLLLLVQGKLSNLTVDERFAFNVSLRMFTRNTYQSDLKRCEAYTAYSNPRGFIYQNKDKKNRLMRIDKLHKFSDGTLNDVRNALGDRLKGIRMQYLPTTIWRKGDKDRAAAMIQAIDKMLKTRRIMRGLESFVGGRQYEGDFRMLQRTI